MNSIEIANKLESEQITPEEILELVSELLKQGDARAEDWKTACNALSRAGRATWWRCGCGEIRPDTGEIDIFCTNCGQMRHLPERLSQSPWPLYIKCLRQSMPVTWFEVLSAWMQQEKLGKLEASAVKSYPLRPDKAGVLPEAIAGEGSCVLPEAIAARGAMPPEKAKIIRCIDGMIIEENGDIRGLQWIALPMMLVL